MTSLHTKYLWTSFAVRETLHPLAYCGSPFGWDLRAPSTSHIGIISYDTSWATWIGSTLVTLGDYHVLDGPKIVGIVEWLLKIVCLWSSIERLLCSFSIRLMKRYSNRIMACYSVSLVRLLCCLCCRLNMWWII
jgi:hypothetical protein